MNNMILAVPKGRILGELTPILKKSGIIPEKDFYDNNSRKPLLKLVSKILI